MLFRSQTNRKRLLFIFFDRRTLSRQFSRPALGEVRYINSTQRQKKCKIVQYANVVVLIVSPLKRIMKDLRILSIVLSTKQDVPLPIADAIFGTAEVFRIFS